MMISALLILTCGQLGDPIKTSLAMPEPPKVRIGRAETFIEKDTEHFVIWRDYPDDITYKQPMFIFKQVVVVHPKNITIKSIRQYAIVKLIKNDSPKDDLYLLDNLETEYVRFIIEGYIYKLTKGRIERAGFSPHELSLLTNLKNNKYKIRQAAQKEVVDKRMIRLVYWGGRNDNPEVRTRSQIAWLKILKKELPSAD